MTSTQVTLETFIRAETDRQFGNVVKMAGGLNRLFHFRSPTPLDMQNVIRMNRDTLYSMGVVDTSAGATLTVPALPEDRYASVYLVDNDHYCPFVIYKSGTHELPRDTKYLGVGVRIQVFNPRTRTNWPWSTGCRISSSSRPTAAIRCPSSSGTANRCKP